MNINRDKYKYDGGEGVKQFQVKDRLSFFKLVLQSSRLKDITREITLRSNHGDAMRTLIVAVLAATVAASGRPVERSDKNRRGSERTQAPTSMHCAWYTSIRHLPTHLPIRLTDYLHFSPANALTVRSHRLRDTRPERCSN